MEERVGIIKAYVDGLGSGGGGGGGGGSSSSSSSNSSSAMEDSAPSKASKHSTLRAIRSLLNRLPVETAEDSLSHEALDSLLVATNACAVSGCAGLSGIVEKLSLRGASFAEGSGGGGRGLGMGGNHRAGRFPAKPGDKMRAAGSLSMGMSFH